MGIDQAHEQNNMVIKGMGGATLVINKDDESGLAWWDLCLHELPLIINEYKNTPKVKPDFEPLRHLKDSKAFQNQFSADVSRLKTSILMNPFKLNKLTVLINEKSTFSDIVYDDISKMSKLGEEQFQAFWTDRLVTCKVPVSDPILLNSLNLPGNPNKATERSCCDISDNGETKEGRRNTRWICWKFVAHWDIWNSSKLVCKPIFTLSWHEIACNKSISYNIQAFISFNEEWNNDWTFSAFT